MQLFKSLVSFLFKLFKFVLVTATILLILAAIIGHTVRDRTVELGLLMYIPLLPVGIFVVLVDLSLKGRSIFFRFSLTLIGLGIMTWGGLTMVGTGGQINSEPDRIISVLHWNVHYGAREQSHWKSIRNDIEQRHPDFAIISEPPAGKKFNLLLKQMNWSAVKYNKTSTNTIAICSTWPVNNKRLVKIRNGRAMLATVTIRGKSLRILAIDGNRNMSKRYLVMSRRLLPRWRTPMLTDIAKAVKIAQKHGQTIDIIAGDFNAISISSGFDAFAHIGGGYKLASKFADGWRGTWKSYLPLYDVDHVWVHKRFQAIRTKLFTNLKSDHRGQLVELQLPL